MTASPACLSRQVGDFFAPGGGAYLFCRRLTLPPLYPAGGLPSLSPAAPLPLACFPAPYPPAPFPAGEGGDYKFISPGASPPAPLH